MSIATIEIRHLPRAVAAGRVAQAVVARPQGAPIESHRMELVDRSGNPAHRHVWLERLGLEESGPEPATWVPIARAFEMDEVATRSSRVASRLVVLLSRADIPAQQHPYEFDELQRGRRGFSHERVTRVAVLVQHRHFAQAVEIAAEFQHGLGLEEQLRERESLVSDEELAREALDAGPPPEE